MIKFKLFFASCVLLSASSLFAFDENHVCPASIVSDISSRHPLMNADSMLEEAGGEDHLVSCLLSLRLQTKPPFLGTRAEKLLIHFQHRKDVQEALLSDVSAETRFGLGSIVLSSLPSIKDDVLRKQIVSRATSSLKSTTNHQIKERYQLILEQTPEEYK